MDTNKYNGMQFDQYLIEKHLARGGMADVYLARDVSLNRQVAIKILLDALAQDPQFILRFQREARAVARLDHPGIVQVYSTGVTSQGQPYIAMQYISGGSLRDLLRGWAAQNKVAPAAQALAVAHHLASALNVAHQAGIVHRDLKPSNVLIRSDGMPVLVDLGIAAMRGSDRLTQTGALMGTPHYMSPEQIKGAPLDGRSDIYSLGVILYEMLAGIRPFEADESIAILHKHVYEAPVPLEQLRGGLTPQTLQLVNICLEKEPDGRYQNAGELLAAIDAALAAEGTGGYVPRTTVLLPDGEADLLSKSRYQPQAAAPGGKGTGRRNLLISGGILGILLLLLFGAIGMGGLGGASPAPTATLSATPPTVAPEDTPNNVVNLTAPTEISTVTVEAAQTPLPEDSPVPTATAEPPPTETAEPPQEETGLPTTFLADDGMDMLLVPAGEFIMGSTSQDVAEASRICSRNPDGDSCAEREFASEMPQREVYLSDFYIDKTEVTNAQYKECVRAGNCNSPPAGNGRYDRDSYYDDSSFANYPVVWVSWSDARDYCRWAGKRLPTEAEWEKAARGEDGRIFPWGDTFEVNKANTQDRGTERITPVGQYPNGASPYGVLDMAGNVWEYVADWFDQDYYANAPDTDPQGPNSSPVSRKVLRSGSYANYQQYARIANRGTVDPSSNTQFRGIRCAISANQVIP